MQSYLFLSPPTAVHNAVHWTLTIQGHRLPGPCFNEVAGCRGDLQPRVNEDKNTALSFYTCKQIYCPNSVVVV